MKDIIIKVGIYFLFALFILPGLILNTSIGFVVILFSLILSSSTVIIGIKSGSFKVEEHIIQQFNDVGKDINSAKETIMLISFGVMIAISLALYFTISLISSSFALMFLTLATIDAVYSDVMYRNT